MVTIELIDFTIHKDELQVVGAETSSDHDDDDNNIQYLFNLLKKTIRNNRYKKFSLQFEHVVTLENVTNLHNYDILICEKHNIVIATQHTSILIYNRIISSQPPIPDIILFKVEFNVNLRCLKLSEEVDGDYLYVSTSDNSILKINFTQLLITKDQSIIWTSETFENLWGIDILNNRVFGVEHNKGIIVLDCESGKTITNPKPKLPTISKGYQLVFISPTEMIVSHNCCVELYHLVKKKWKSMKKTSFPIRTAYSMFYERNSKLIYLADSSGLVGEKLKVINGEDLSLVKSFGDFNSNFGMCIDRLSGLLYVCDTCNYIIKVYQ